MKFSMPKVGNGGELIEYFHLPPLEKLRTTSTFIGGFGCFHIWQYSLSFLNCSASSPPPSALISVLGAPHHN